MAMYLDTYGSAHIITENPWIEYAGWLGGVSHWASREYRPSKAIPGHCLAVTDHRVNHDYRGHLLVLRLEGLVLYAPYA